MTQKKTQLWTKVLLISVLFIFLMIVLGEAVTTGERLRNVSVVLEVFYYVLILVVFGFGIVYPIFGVFSAPVFSLEKLHYADGKARKKWCKKLVKNLLNNVDLSAEEKTEVKNFLTYEDLTDDKLIEFFDRKIRPQINAEIYDTAKKVMVVTSISQNSVYDMIGMATINFNLVRRIVEICGFRPTTPQVVGLYVKVLSYSVVAGSLEDLNLEDFVSTLTENSLGKIGGVIFASATQGIVNALMTLRIATITKNYLLNANVYQTREELKRKSFSEAMKLLREIATTELSKKIKNPVKGLFKKKEEVVID